MNLLQVNQLRTYYFTRGGVVKAVDDATIDVNEGQIVGLVGESGCGKSTLALSIMRLIQDPGRIVKGQIIFRGRDLLGLTEEGMRQIRGKDIAMIFQDPMTYLNPVLRVKDQVAEVLRTHATTTNTLGEVEDLLSMVNAPGITDYFPHQLSGGLRQRVLISMALACKPSFLIADEPTTSLDVTVQAQILELLKELVRTLRLSMLIITHNLGIIAEICDKVYLMYAGKVVEEGDVNAIFYDHKHPYTTGLLQSARSLQRGDESVFTIPGEPPDLIRPPNGCRFHPRCPYVLEVCRKKEPSMTKGGSGHSWFCWLYGAEGNE